VRVTKQERFLGEFAKWRADREALSAAEESGAFPDPNDWEASDEAAIELLRWVAKEMEETPHDDIVNIVRHAEAAETIAAHLDGRECAVEDLEEIADILRNAGLQVGTVVLNGPDANCRIQRVRAIAC
jgi:hypothetical protein